MGNGAAEGRARRTFVRFLAATAILFVLGVAGALFLTKVLFTEVLVFGEAERENPGPFHIIVVGRHEHFGWEDRPPVVIVLGDADAKALGTTRRFESIEGSTREKWVISTRLNRSSEGEDDVEHCFIEDVLFEATGGVAIRAGTCFAQNDVEIEVGLPWK